jgi:hypothetical protein
MRGSAALAISTGAPSPARPKGEPRRCRGCGSAAIRPLPPPARHLFCDVCKAVKCGECHRVIAGGHHPGCRQLGRSGPRRCLRCHDAAVFGRDKLCTSCRAQRCERCGTTGYHRRPHRVPMPPLGRVTVAELEEAILANYYAALKRARALVGPAGQDVVQDAVLAVWARRDFLRLDGSLGTYFLIAVTRAAWRTRVVSRRFVPVGPETLLGLEKAARRAAYGRP